MKDQGTHLRLAAPLSSAATPPPLCLTPRETRATLGRHFLQAFAFNCALWVLHVLASPGSMDIKFVYSQAIGLSIWFIIDGGRLLLRPNANTGWPSPPRTVALITVGVLGGYTNGTLIGDVYCGCSTWELMTFAPRRVAVTLFGTLFAASVAIYFFHSRGQAEAQRIQLAASERDATLAKLTLLQSQLEPHMLFNTLANLRVLIALDPTRAQAMLDRLIAYLRATLSASRANAHALAAEFERVDDFLALMSVRMGERLRSSLVLPAELRELAVPPLLLQPLIENAIKHGLEPKVEGGRIEVRAERNGDQLWLSVRDTGVGLGPVGSAFAAAAGGAAASTGGTSFGLQQVRERLNVLFGERAALSLQAAPDAEGGVLARIVLPLEPSKTAVP
jgi:Histidine kinase/Histidine kinase-, DNA gyrase B-, and HSP90-like ATPase